MKKEVRTHNSNLTEMAKRLRANSTKEETKLWYDFLRTLPVHFCRQKIIGNYIVDFYCASKKLVIELDGSQHFEDAGIAHDLERDAYLSSLGLTVVHYSNYDFSKMYDAICADILCRIGLE